MTVSPSEGEGGEKTQKPLYTNNIFLMAKKRGNFFFSSLIWRPNIVYAGEPRRLRISASPKNQCGVGMAKLLLGI